MITPKEPSRRRFCPTFGADHSKKTNKPEKKTEEEEAEMPTLVPTVISWWTLLGREDSVLEAAGRKTQKTAAKGKQR